MEKICNAYEKTVNGTTFYFVKQYRSFPELKNVPPILETFGMHRNFVRACHIARVSDEQMMELAEKLSLFESSREIIAPVRPGIFEKFSFRLRLPEFNPLLLKRLGLR